MSNDTDKKYLKRAVELAKKSVEKGGFPAGALVVKDGEIISEGISVGYILHDPTSHAETASIREACKALQTSNLEGATLYENLQSCIMCFSVAYWAGISRIVAGCRKTEDMAQKGYYEGLGSIQELNQLNNRKIDLEYMLDFEQESLDIIKTWEEKQNEN